MRRATTATAGLLGLLAALAWSRTAAAQDAQSLAMGATGTAYIDDGSAITFNPALLHQTGALTATLALAGASARLETPIAGPNTGFASAATPFPLALAGVHYRVNDRLVLGVAAYPSAGFGAKYENVINAENVTLTAASVEIAPSASFALRDELAIGVSYRVGYTALSAGAPLFTTYETESLSGTSLLGAQLGVFYRPLPSLRLGLAYKTKTHTSLSGSTDFNGQSYPTTSSIDWPHQLRFGAAWSTDDGALLVAVDALYAAFSDATQDVVLTQQYPSGPKTLDEPLDWRDSFGLGVGAQYVALRRVPIRIGYSLVRSQTRDDAASYFSLPPGLLHGFHAGAGVNVARWSVDLGGFYQGSAHDVPVNTIANPGRFAARVVAVALSATFRIEKDGS
jgi:long-chain fatty acid transport protein